MGDQNNTPNYIIGIGASAGGLEALELFFSNVGTQTGNAYVVIQHLSPDFKSMMPEILSRVTNLPIYPIENGIVVEPDTIYLNVPRHDVRLQRNRLLLESSKRASTALRPINIFFSSMAKDLGEKAIGIILSGSGHDGTEGIADIDAAGGLTMAQDLDSALFSSMPKSAAQKLTNIVVDLPSSMPDIITNYVLSPTKDNKGLTQAKIVDGDENALTYLISLMRRKFEIDFTRYKPYTLFRRLDARIRLTHVKDLAEYILLLQEDHEEQNALYRDLLIDVTSFFRDPEAYKIIEEKILPTIVDNKVDGDTIRLWVAACATGEEAYSLAILINEEIEKQGRDLGFKIFATDAHHDSISRASEGIFDFERVQKIPKELGEKYFTPVKDSSGRFLVAPIIRSSIVFATHNLLENPHFSYLDMVSCRNFLIYIENEAQNELLFRFHMGLKLGGCLFLGSSEHLSETADDYDVVSTQWRIYRKVSEKSRPVVKERADVVSRLPKYMQQQARLSGDKNWETRLLQELFKTGYVVDSQGSLKEVYGDGRKFLQFKTGKVALTLTSLLPDDLAIPIRTGLQMAQQQKERVRFDAVRLGSGFERNDSSITNTDHISSNEQYLSIDIVPFQGDGIETGASGKFYLISLASVNIEVPSSDTVIDPVSASSQRISSADKLSKISSLERELTFTRESLQATIEEMQSANEELQSANEELQSTNEELSSVNEELFTVNSEYQDQSKVYTQLNSDMRNMLLASNVLILLLNEDFTLREVTPYARSLFGFLEADTGRSLLHFNLFKNVESEILEGWLLSTLHGKPVFEGVITNSNVPLSLQITPYISSDGSVDGLVLYFGEAQKILDLELFRSLSPSINYFQQLQSNEPNLITVYDYVMDETVFIGGSLLSLLKYDSLDHDISLKSLLHENDRTDWNKKRSAVLKLQDGELDRCTHLLKLVDGSPALCIANEGVYARNKFIELTQSISVITLSRDLSKFAIED